jgi:spore germination protein (amino acid permease)
MKKSGQQPFLPWLKQQYGGLVSWTYRIFFITYLILIGAMTLKDTTMWTHASYLPRTPQPVIAASLVLLCGFAAYSGIRAIAVSSGILLPFVIIFGDFVMSANLPAKNYSLLTPMLENGWAPLLKGSMDVGGGLAELIIILLIQHHMKSRVRLWSLYLLALFLILLVFGPVTGAIAEFGPFEAAELRYPAYEEWRLVTIGKYIRHVDFLSIYQWLSGAFVRLALSILLLVEIFTNSNRTKRRVVWLVCLCAGMEGLAILPVSDMQYFSFLARIYLPGSLWMTTAALLVLPGLTLISRKNRGGIA